MSEVLDPERLALMNQFLKFFIFILAGFVGFLVIMLILMAYFLV